MSHDPDDLYGRQKYDEALRRSKVRSLRAISRIRTIDERAGEIARTERAAKASTLLAQMREELAGTLTRISTCAARSSERWHACLSSIDLTSASAAAELADLCDTIDRERASWAVTPSPDPAREPPLEAPQPWGGVPEPRPAAVVPPLDARVAGRPRLRVARERSIPDLFTRIAEQKHALEQWRQDVALSLELIVSSLRGLMSMREVYEATTR